MDIVVGLGFGDEGKGKVVHYLAQQYDSCLVTRYSGGQQAGHTVVTDNIRHVFANMGSGTLAGAPTYWAETCTLNPSTLLQELDVLEKQNIKPCLFINRNVPITTQGDIRMQTGSPQYQLHGTCGMGVGTTIGREKNNFHLHVGDICFPNILHTKLLLIQDYYKSCGTYLTFEEIYELLENCKILVNKYNIVIVDKPPYYKNNIFEGSQGILLDQDIGFFPHVTRSNTTATAAYKIARKMGDLTKPIIYAITRAYQTRHGNGPMIYSYQDMCSEISIDHSNDTNQTNHYQGPFKYTYLNVEGLKYAIYNDPIMRDNLDCVILVINHLDLIKNKWFLCVDDRITSFSSEEAFITCISEELNISNILKGYSPNSVFVKQFQEET